MNERRFEFSEGTSNKFWTIRVDGASTHVIFGRIGTAGQTVDKTFADAAAAQKSADKLIAEKLGKGYVEIGGSQKPAQTKEEIRNSKSEIRNKSKNQKSKTETNSKTEIKQTAGGLKLDPRDRLWVTYEKHDPLPRPEPPVFDKERKALCEKWYDERYDAALHKRLPLVMSREEAEFWFKSFTGRKWSAEFVSPTCRHWEKAAMEAMRWPMYIPLANLLTLDQFTNFLTEPSRIKNTYFLSTMLSNLRAAFRDCIFPFLDEAQKNACRKQIRAAWGKLSAAHVENTSLPMIFAAAMLGMHKEIESFVKGFPDGSSRDYWLTEPIFGLGSRDEVERQFQRLGLKLVDEIHIPIWLAHFGLERMGLIEESIIACSNKADATRLARRLCEVADDPRLAPTMLRLCEESKANEFACKWLENHPDWTRDQLTPIAKATGKLAEVARRWIEMINEKHPQQKPAAVEPKPDTAPAAPINSAGSGLRLEPRDYQWVTYANHPPLKKPEPRPFDIKQCEEYVKNYEYNRRSMRFAYEKLPFVMSKEEACWWFARFARKKYIASNWRFTLSRMTDWDEPVHIAVANMISPEEYIEVVIHPETIDYQYPYDLVHFYNWIRTGFQECVFPYLSENLRADMRKQIRADWKMIKGAVNPMIKGGVTPVYSAAALLGMHDEIAGVVESWSDDEFSYDSNKRGEFLCNLRVQEFVFGLEDPDKIEHHMRRLNLKLKYRAHFAAWFAHFGLERMEWIEQSIIAISSRAEANEAVKTIASLADDPRLAPTMLRLSVESKGAEPARKWLEQHPDWTREQLAPIANGTGKLADAAQHCIKLIEDVQPQKKPAAAQQSAATAAVAISEAIPEIKILGDNKIERRMTLPPRIACRITYNRPQPLPLPKPKPFDLDACMKRLESTFMPHTDEEIQRLEMLPSMERREVEFWHFSLTDDHDRLMNEKKWRKKILSRDYPGTITIDQLIRGTQAMTWGDCPRERVALLGAIAGLSEATEELLKLGMKQGGWNHEYAEGFFRYLLPYMGEKQIAQARKTALAEWSKHKWVVKNNNGYQHIIFYIVAGLGLHDELLKLIESWPNGAYADYSKPKGRLYHDELAEELVFGLGSSELVGRHFRRLGMKLIDEERAWVWLAHTGADGLDVLWEAIKRFRGKNDLMAMFKPLRSFESPETAQIMFRMVQANKLAEEARAWLDKNPRLAAAGLIPLAAGQSEECKIAANILRSLMKASKAEVDPVIDLYPKDQAKLIRERLLTDSMQQVSLASKDAMPSWWTEAVAAGAKQVTSLNWLSLRELPPLTIDGRTLEADEMRGVLWAVMKSTLDAPHPVVEALRRRGDQAANDAFARFLCQCWLTAQAPSKDKWALLAIGLLGGDEAAMWITPHIRRWPGESQHQRAVAGLDVLRAIGTDTALMQLNGIAQKLKFRALKERAAQCIENIAAARGLTRDELEDLIVPDCGFDERGRYTIDFGPRQFEVVLDAELKPIVRDASGKELSSLPKPASSDDKTKAEEAAAAFTLMKKQLRDVVSIQSTRLERAMIGGRRWPVKTFETCLARHPLMRHLTSRLIWEGLDKTGKRIGLFRVAEDLSYADEKNNTIKLDAFTSVGIPHPLNMSAAEQQAWGKVMADYEITAPFMQLGREICELTPAERDAKEIKRWAEYEIMGLTIVRTLDKFGWNKCGFSDGGSFNSHYKVYPASGVTAVCEYEGAYMGMTPEDDEAQPIHTVFFLDSSRASECYYDAKGALVLGKVDPVAMSETLRELTIVASKGKAPIS